MNVFISHVYSLVMFIMTKQPSRKNRAGLGQIPGKEISLIQAIPYTQNKFWKHG